jgi:ABC-type sugar transport system substrate-binding protein
VPYRVLITGDRNWACLDLARVVVARLIERHGDIEVVHGGAAGVDTAFALAAADAGAAVHAFPADWDRHGKRAGPLRNAEMVASGADVCLAFHARLKWSKGTRDCVTRALKAGIPVWLVDADDAEKKPVRITLEDLG